MQEQTSCYDEDNFLIMPAIRETSPAQIPIRAKRFEYLTKNYKPGEKDSRWIMFHHPGHFMIYDKETRYCIFDGTYTLLGNAQDPQTREDDELVAVIYDIRICPEEFRPSSMKEDEFGTFASLIHEEL